MRIVGSPADDGKRFATLNITARAVCDDSKVRRGQPKLSITFRGQGKKISAEEKAGYHPDVLLRFQKKAWADDEVCEEQCSRFTGIRKWYAYHFFQKNQNTYGKIL